MEITAIKVRGKGKGLAQVLLEGGEALILRLPVVQEAGLRPGQSLSPSKIEDLKREDLFSQCFDASLRYLSYRPQSGAELREKLLRRGFNRSTIGRVLLKLRDRSLLDDAAFARFWRESRETLNPRGSWLIRLELKRKGVEEQIIDEATEGLDDESNAYKVARKKARALASLEYPSFWRRLAGFLQRRGFSYGVIKRVADRVWQEQHKV